MLNKNGLPRPKRRPALPPERQIVVRGDHITLGQLLKAADIISTGGEAKFYLADTVAYVNGEPEQRRGRKLRAGDLIAFPDAPPVRLVAPPEAADAPLPTASPTSAETPRAKNKPGGDVRPVSPLPHENPQEPDGERRQEQHSAHPQEPDRQPRSNEIQEGSH